MQRKPWIVCAAMQHKDCIITGARHFDLIMQRQIELYRIAHNNGNHIKWEQGFIDQFGKFYNRHNAMQIVKESGQPFNAERNSGSGEELYSEGLY